MKILSVNKYHKIVGGADRYALNLTNLLRQHGHKVAFLAPSYPDDLPAEYPLYGFRAGLTSGTWMNTSWFRALRAYVDGIYNLAAASAMEQAIEDFHPDIVHCHNLFYQVSPAVIQVARRHAIPVVQTLHDYQVVCASNTLFARGQICEQCRRTVLSILKQRCYNNSLAASWLAFSAKIAHTATGLYPLGVDHYIAPSRFVINEIASFGLTGMPPISHVPHFIAVQDIEPNCTPGDYILYYGGFIQYKGIDTLLEAIRITHHPLILAGRGPYEEAVRAKVAGLGLTNVQIVGFKSGLELDALIRNARLVVVPSQVYETFGLVVIEAYACGKPVIAADIGGLPELVDEEVGALFPPGDADALATAIEACVNNQDRLRQMGRAARERVVRNHSPEAHYARLLNIYEKLLTSRNPAGPSS